MTIPDDSSAVVDPDQCRSFSRSSTARDHVVQVFARGLRPRRLLVISAPSDPLRTSGQAPASTLGEERALFAPGGIAGRGLLGKAAAVASAPCARSDRSRAGGCPRSAEARPAGDREARHHDRRDDSATGGGFRSVTETVSR
jgi:hypothetical protein